MKLPLPDGEYIKTITVNDDGLDVEFAPRKKIALLFVGINQLYWDYLKQCIQDCRTNFLPQHTVDYFVWSDMPEDSIPNVTFTHTEPVGWPAPTLMRYHLFLQQEAKLSEYDYVFYLDADMRVIQKISDEILGEGLTTAPHPGYAIDKKFIPPYEPNPKSQAYIPRLGRLVDEGGKKRFIPFYAAGGFQGGTSAHFISAMKDMKKSIDKDFDNNYTAIWNDESHWNRYLWDYQKTGGSITFLDVSYIYPDSLIKEYYEPRVWGRSYDPKIITLTKPHTLQKINAQELFGGAFQCGTCGDQLTHEGHKILKVVTCPGKGKPHQLEMVKL